MAGLEWVPLDLSKIGEHCEAGSVLDEFNEELKTLANKVRDEDRYGKKGKITITLELERSKDGRSLIVDGKVAVKPPPRRRPAAWALFGPNGKLLVEKSEQLSILDQMNDRGREAKEEEPAKVNGSPKGSPKEKG